MSAEQWELTTTPTAAEAHEAMVLVRRTQRSRGQRILMSFQAFLIGICAPLGATVFLLGAVFLIEQLRGGQSFLDSGPVAILVAVILFFALAFWTYRQTYFMLAQAIVRSRFGRVQQVVLNETGLTLTTANSRWQSGWGDVEGVHPGTRTLAVDIGGIAIALPRRAFEGRWASNDALAAMQHWQETAR
jgi:hypothetical protein